MDEHSTKQFEIYQNWLKIKSIQFCYIKCNPVFLLNTEICFEENCIYKTVASEEVTIHVLFKRFGV